jgi:hypothetical protein
VAATCAATKLAIQTHAGKDTPPWPCLWHGLCFGKAQVYVLERVMCGLGYAASGGFFQTVKTHQATLPQHVMAMLFCGYAQDHNGKENSIRASKCGEPRNSKHNSHTVTISQASYRLSNKPFSRSADGQCKRKHPCVGAAKSTQA